MPSAPKQGSGAQALKSLHPSKLKGRPQPRGMAVAHLDDATRQMIEEEALSIFTEMVNSGASLQKTLAAVFLSGMRAAHVAGQ